MRSFGQRINGATLACVETGDGLPVVFLHAGVCDHRMWESQMAEVAAEGFHAIAYDRRGYGDTVSDDIGFSHLGDLEALLAQLDIHAAIFVGCSLGGGLALDFALKHPGRVIGLVLIGTSVSGAPWEAKGAELAIEMAEEDAFERGDLEMLNRVQAHEWLDGPRAESGRVGGAVRTLFLDMNSKALNQPALHHEEQPPEAYSRVSQIGTPTLLLVGEEDFSALIERHEYLSEEMPNAFAVVLEGTAHIPSIDRPDLVNPLLLEFLDTIMGGDDGDDDVEDEEQE